jgi:hypothetical protein
LRKMNRKEKKTHQDHLHQVKSGSAERRSASEKLVDFGCPGSGKERVGGGTNSWDRYSLALTNGVIVEN